MESVFPFGLPWPTAFYLSLYVLTFALHHAFMHYVAAGSMYISWATIFRGPRGAASSSPAIADLIRDWMPFSLSAAITAGVAPLLFVQIVYPRHFYTANLLLSWRWMIVVPVLIVSFYLLYVIKSSMLVNWSWLARSLVVAATSGCFLFVGFCWTANHLLANNEHMWADVYASNVIPLAPITILLRTLVWVGGSFSTLATIVGWQLKMTQKDDERESTVGCVRQLAMMSVGGLLVAAIAGLSYLFVIDQTARNNVLGVFAAPYLAMAIAGMICQTGLWLKIFHRDQVTAGWLAVLSLACVLTLVGTTVLRESIRLSDVEVTQLYARHADAAAIGGLPLFLVFVVINAGLIATCIWLARRSLAA
jgi:hypothetical protein